MATVTASFTGLSITTPSLSSNPSADDTPSGNLAMAARNSSAAPLRMAANASVTVRAPKRSHSSLMRCAPICVTAICAWISPRMSAGCRLLERMMRSTSVCAMPASTILIGGTKSPSWKISVASAEVEPATVPPTSALCAIEPENATISPAAKTGATKAMSETCGRPPS